MHDGLLGGSDAKESDCNAGASDSISGSGRSPGEGNDNPLQSSSGEFHGQKRLAGYSPWDRKESDRTELLSLHFTMSPTQSDKGLPLGIRTPLFISNLLLGLDVKK